MANAIIILGKSGTGKSSSIKGLDPKETVVLNVLGKKLPFKGSSTLYNKEAKNLFRIDDFNYLAQDFYMANAMKGGWDTPKQIGYGMGLIFDAFKGLPEDKNIICCAHYEEYKDKNGDSISYKFKTTGKMVDDYITPEGKFDIILFGKVGYDAENKRPIKHFVKEFDGEYPAKDSLGALDDLPDEIPNDLSIVVDKLREIYG